MGVEDRDWYRDAAAPSRSSAVRGSAIVGAVLVGLILAGGARVLAHRRVAHAVAARASLIPDLPGVTIRRTALYPSDDAWRAYLADERTCPGGERTDLPAVRQADTMVCLVNYARARRHLAPLATAGLLDTSAAAKADRIVRCGQFAHDACGVDAADDARRLGYTGEWGENLFVATGRYGAPRVAMDGWLNSPGHRENLFRPEWRIEGIAVEKLARFGDDRNLTLWVNQFGT